MASSFSSLKSSIFESEERKQQYQAHIRGLNAYDCHKKFLKDYDKGGYSNSGRGGGGGKGWGYGGGGFERGRGGRGYGRGRGRMCDRGRGGNGEYVYDQV